MTLDGKKKEPEVVSGDGLLQSVINLRAENNRLKEELEAKQEPAPILTPNIDRFMGMLLLDSKPTNVAVNQALKKQAKRWHPDQSGDAEVFKQLQEAKTQLLKIC